MNETITTPIANKIRLLDGSAEMSVSSLSHSNDTFAVTLTSTQKASFEDLSHQGA